MRAWTKPPPEHPEWDWKLEVCEQDGILDQQVKYRLTLYCFRLALITISSEGIQISVLNTNVGFVEKLVWNADAPHSLSPNSDDVRVYSRMPASRIASRSGSPVSQ